MLSSNPSFEFKVMKFASNGRNAFFVMLGPLLSLLLAAV